MSSTPRVGVFCVHGKGGMPASGVIIRTGFLVCIFLLLGQVQIWEARNHVRPASACSIPPNIIRHSEKFLDHLKESNLRENARPLNTGLQAVPGIASTSLECHASASHFPVCWFDNLYYDGTRNVYLAVKLHGHPRGLVKHFEKFDTLEEIHELPTGRSVLPIPHPAILGQPPHPSYCHGFLEELHCLFWEALVMQNRSYALDTSRLIFWISRSTLFDEFPHNWDNLVKHEDGHMHYKFAWREDAHQAFSDYPLGFSGSMNNGSTLVHFKRLLVPSHCMARSVFVNRHGFNHPSRSFQFEPFPERVMGRYMLLFGDHMLRRFSIKSKFNLTGCEHDSELVVVSPRMGEPRRQILNSKDFVDVLRLKVQLPVIEYEFASLRDTMKIMRSTRLLITPHGAGMSNLLFMPPGASVLETDSFLCGYMADYFGQLAKVLDLNHQVWVELKPMNPRDSCEFNSHITLDIDQVSHITQELLERDAIFRGAHLEHALAKVYLQNDMASIHALRHAQV